MRAMAARRRRTTARHDRRRPSGHPGAQTAAAAAAGSHPWESSPSGKFIAGHHSPATKTIRARSPGPRRPRRRVSRPGLRVLCEPLTHSSSNLQSLLFFYCPAVRVYLPINISIYIDDDRAHAEVRATARRPRALQKRRGNRLPPTPSLVSDRLDGNNNLIKTIILKS